MDLQCHVHVYYSELIDSTDTFTCTMVVLDDITCNIECTLVTVKITNKHPLTLCERETKRKKRGTWEGVGGGWGVKHINKSSMG